jgi:hypothetical protein
VVPRILPQAFLVPPLQLEHLLEFDPHPLGAVASVVDPVVGLLLDQRVGEVDVDRVDQRLQREVADLGLCLTLLHVRQSLPEVVAELIHGVEFRCGLRELVVDVGQRSGFHVLHQRRDLDLRAAEVLAEPLREHVGGLQDRARPRADQLDVELVPHLRGPHPVQVVLPGGLLDRLSALGDGQVDRHEVVLLGGTTDRLELGEPLPEPLDPLVDVRVGDLDRRLGHVDTRVVGLLEREPRADLDGRREDERLARLELLDLDVRVGDRCQVLVAHRPAEVGRDRGAHELLEDHVAPDLGVDDLLGDPALAEAWDLDLVRDRPVGAVEVLVELVGGDLDRELHGVRRGGFDGGLHRAQATRPVVLSRSRSVRGRLVPSGPCSSRSWRSPTSWPTGRPRSRCRTSWASSRFGRSPTCPP